MFELLESWCQVMLSNRIKELLEHMKDIKEQILINSARKMPNAQTTIESFLQLATILESIAGRACTEEPGGLATNLVDLPGGALLISCVDGFTMSY